MKSFSFCSAATLLFSLSWPHASSEADGWSMMDPHCDIFILLSVTLPSSSLGDSSSSAAAAPSDGAGEWLTRLAEGDVKWEDLSVLLPSGSSEVCRCYCCCRKILALTWASRIGLHTSSTKCVQRRKNMQMTKWLIFYHSPDCLEACLDLYVICSFLTNICAYFLFAWDVISLWFVAGRRCFPLSCVSNMRQKKKNSIQVRTVQLCVKEGRYTFSFFLQFSVLYRKREKKQRWIPQVHLLRDRSSGL